MATPIARNLPSQEMVIELINRDNGLYLSSADVLVSNVRDNPTPDTIPGTSQQRDTLADLLAVYGGGFKANTTITYRRLDAGVIFGSVITALPPNGQTTTYDLLDDLNAAYGLALAEDDIVKDRVDISTLPVTVSVQFKADNPAWKGEIPVVIRRVPIDLASVVVNRTLPLLRYPTGQSTLIQGDLYAYSRDFSTYSGTLTTLTVNSPLDPLVTVLNAVFAPDVWVIRPTTVDFNLYGAQVLYNGPVIDTYSTRRAFTKVLVVSLASSCANVAGKLIIHYNV